MRTFRARLRPGLGSDTAPDTAPEGGFSLVEVLIAMMVFAILSIGVAYSLLSVLAMTKEGRAREMATNLAAQEIDLDRSAKDVFTLGDSTRTVSNALGSFIVKRTTQWVSGAGEGNGCGSGTGVLQYKRINVSVTWDGMRAGALPVRTDTQLAPKNVINDPALGTIIVSTLTAGGAGSAGISVSAAPTPGVAGNTAVAVTGAATNAQGCSYLLKVVPGTYDVTVSRAGYIDNGQVPTSTKATNDRRHRRDVRVRGVQLRPRRLVLRQLCVQRHRRNSAIPEQPGHHASSARPASTSPRPPPPPPAARCNSFPSRAATP